MCSFTVKIPQKSLKIIFLPYASIRYVSRPPLHLVYGSFCEVYDGYMQNEQKIDSPNIYVLYKILFQDQELRSNNQINFWKRQKCAWIYVKKSVKVPEKHESYSVTHFYGWFCRFWARISRETGWNANLCRVMRKLNNEEVVWWHNSIQRYERGFADYLGHKQFFFVLLATRVLVTVKVWLGRLGICLPGRGSRGLTEGWALTFKGW